MSRQPIARAIETRTLLIFTYHGEERTVEPHILGRSRTGNLMLSGWQRSGDSPGWRNYLVEEIENLTRTAIRFRGARSGYNPADPSFGAVLCRLGVAGEGNTAHARP